MNRKPSISRSFATQVITIITCAMLWLQFLGVIHSIQHGFGAVSSSSTITSFDALTDASSDDQNLSQTLSNTFANSFTGSKNVTWSHHCAAWDACTVTTALFTHLPILFSSSWLFSFGIRSNVLALPTKPILHFLSRAPPVLRSNY